MLNLRNVRTLLVPRISIATISTAGPKNRFGDLSESGRHKLAVERIEAQHPEDPDGYDKEEYDLVHRKNVFYYKHEIKNNARWKGKTGLRKALELFQQMKSHDRLTPTINNFSILMYGCSRAGYTKKAFELYEESLKYIDKPTRSMITCLINACGESPFPEYALEKLRWFMIHIKTHYDIPLTRIHYHCAIKAYGKLGDLDEVSRLVEEMLQNSLPLNTDTFNNLLFACSSDPEKGTLIAYRLYKRMKAFGLSPDHNTYRLLIRCIRDCGLGSEELLIKTLNSLPQLSDSKQQLVFRGKPRKTKGKDLLGERQPLKLSSISSIAQSIKSDFKLQELKSGERVKFERGKAKEVAVINEDNETDILKLPPATNELPNLLIDSAQDLAGRVELIEFDRLKYSHNRLMLFGGMNGFLEAMLKDGIKADNKSFSLILNCLPYDEISQRWFLETAKQYKVDRDLLFYDLLLRHVSQTPYDPNRISRALDIIQEMQEEGIRPNVTSFNALARACDNIETATRLISDVEGCGFTVSHIMLNMMFKAALSKFDFEYASQLVTLSKTMKHMPYRSEVRHIQKRIRKFKELVNQYELGEKNGLTIGRIDHFKKFCALLENWLSEVKVYEENENPLDQFDIGEVSSHRREFGKFAEQFKKLEKAKENSLREGKPLGNLMKKSMSIDLSDDDETESSPNYDEPEEDELSDTEFLKDRKPPPSHARRRKQK